MSERVISEATLLRNRAAAHHGDPRVQQIVQDLCARFALLVGERQLDPVQALAAIAGVSVGLGMVVHSLAKDQARGNGPDPVAYRIALGHLIDAGLAKVIG